MSAIQEENAGRMSIWSWSLPPTVIALYFGDVWVLVVDTLAELPFE